jgi:hypothetical protein
MRATAKANRDHDRAVCNVCRLHGVRSHVYLSYAASADRLRRSESDRLRLHLTPLSASKHISAQPVLALHLWGKCPAISGSQLGDGLASSFANVAAAEASGSAARWMVYRQFAPVAPQTTINFGMTMVFPSCNITGAGRTHRSRRISYVDHTGPFLPQYSRVVRIVQALSLTSSIAGSMFCLISSCASCEFLARRSYPSPSPFLHYVAELM